MLLARFITQRFALYNLQINCLKSSTTYLLRNDDNYTNGSYAKSYKQARAYSLQSNIESLAKTQTGLFKSLSESTLVEGLQNVLLYVHEVTNMPWWGTIICTTVLLRTAVTLPLAVYQKYIMAKVENINMEMPSFADELKKEMAVAIRMYGWNERTAKIYYKRSLKKQWNNLIVRDNCHPLKAGLLLWFQIPMWIGLSTSLRNLIYELPKLDVQAKQISTELSVQGFGWITNLTQIDGCYILPIVLGLTSYAIIEIQSLSKVTMPSKLQRYGTYFLRIFSLLMIPISAGVPSCLVLYWTTSSTYGLIQNLVLMSPRIRRFCRIPETPSQLEQPYLHLLEGIKYKYSFVNK